MLGIHDDKEPGSLFQVIWLTVIAFFDNDLFQQATKLFMKDAINSFHGLLMVSCSEHAHRQICITAHEKPMSVLAFYPEKGILCCGSEQCNIILCPVEI
jgi:hypothetical protein